MQHMCHNGTTTPANFVATLSPLYALLLQLLSINFSIFYYNPRGLNCNWLWFQQHNLSAQPQWVWYGQLPLLLLHEQHNSQLYVLACLSEKNYRAELIDLTENIYNMKHVRIIIELANDTRSESLPQDILAHLQKRNMYNVLLYYTDAVAPLLIYSSQVFPQFRLRNRRVKDLSAPQLFPRQVGNLQGYELKALHDFSEPNTILYRDATGRERISGFLWNYIKTFTELLNASVLPVHPTWPAGRLLSEPHMLEFTRNGSVDFGLLTMQTANNFMYRYRFRQYSYPLFHTSWCIMLPLGSPIPLLEIYGHLLQSNALVLLVFVLICSYFLFSLPHLPRCLRLPPRVLRSCTYCLCLAQLCRLLVQRPQQPAIDSFDELLQSKLRIFGLSAEFDIMEHDFRARYAEVFRLTRNLSEFFEMRNNFNTSWAYSVTSIKWLVLNEQQRYFQHPLFRYSQSMCLSDSGGNSILLAEDSVYWHALMLYTLRVQQAGLMLHWMQRSYYDMVRAGRMKIKDYSLISAHKPLKVKDLKFVWRCYVVGLLIALFSFGVELLRFYVNVWLNHL